MLDKLIKNVHWRNLLIVLLGGSILLVINHYTLHSFFIHEFIIVIMAAFLVSAYFEFNLRKSISSDNMRMYEMREELGKAGILKYYSSFEEVNLKSFFTNDIKQIDIYVNFGDTVFSNLASSIYQFCQTQGNELNVFMLSPNNKFIIGLGEFWGSGGSKYNEDGIKAKISSSLGTITSLINQLKSEGKLKSKVNIYLLKKNPVFHSFYRFDNRMVYALTKVVVPKVFIPPAFLVQRTIESDGLYNKCLQELEIIKADTEALETYYTNG